MKIKNRILYWMIVLVAIILSFNSVYKSLISEFDSLASSKEALVRENIEVSTDIINALALHSTLFLEEGQSRDSEYIDLLEYVPETNSFNLDAVEGTETEKIVGNLTGIGKIPSVGMDRVELNLALQLNRYFKSYFDKFPDVTWLYYISDNNYLNIYPWVSSKLFTFSEKLKTLDFFKNANAQNNPDRTSFWTSVYLDEAGKGLMVTLAEPVYLKDTFKGVVSLDLTNDRLSEILNSEYESYLVDDTNTVLASNQKQLSDQSLTQLETYINFPQKNIEKILDDEKDEVHWVGGYFIHASRFESTPWRLYVFVPVWLIFAKASLFTIPILLISFLFLLSRLQIEKRKATEAQLKSERELFKATLLALNEGIIVTDLSSKITLMNKAAEIFTGWTKEEAYGVDFQKVFNNVDILTREKGKNPIDIVLETKVRCVSPKNMGVISKDGIETYIAGSAMGIFTEGDIMTGVLVSLKDITLEYEQETEIKSFLDINLDMLCVTDKEGNFVKVNKKFEEIMGYSTEDLKGISFFSLVHEDDMSATLDVIDTLKAMKQVHGFTTRFKCKNGTYKYLEWVSQSSHVKYVYSSARDVTERFISNEKLEKAALKDQLTGVYNRHYLDMVIEREMKISEHNNSSVSMILCDLDHFKRINDRWGHPVGDIVLKHTAQIISHTIRSSDILVRFGGEEFIVLMPNTSQEGAISAAEKIRETMEAHVFPMGEVMTASFGIAERMANETFDEWYQRLDEALYRSKEGGRNRVSY